MSDFNKSKPLEGNGYIVDELLNQLNSLDNSGGFSTYWLIILSQLNYYSNLFKVKTDDARYKMLEPILLTNLWWFGKLGIIKIGDKRYICTYAADEYDAFGNPTSGNARIISYLFASPSGDKPDSYANAFDLNINESNFVFLRWGNLGLPGWMYWQKYAKQQEQLLKAIFTDVFWMGKKMHIKVNGALTDQQRGQLNELVKIGLPAIVEQTGMNKNNPTGLLDEYMPLDLPPISNETWDFATNHHNYWARLNGKRHNEYEKKERSINGEVSMSISNSDIYENDVLRELNKTSLLLFDKFGDVVEFEKTYDLKEGFVNDDNIQ